MTIKILPNERGIPQSKLADAELVFDEGILDGLKLVGFGIWEGREGRHVTFPARPFLSNGERRTYSILRPVGDASAQEPLRRLILQAFTEYEHQAAALLAAPLDLTPSALPAPVAPAAPAAPAAPGAEPEPRTEPQPQLQSPQQAEPDAEVVS